MLSAQEKQIVEERLSMYDSLLDNDPEIKERLTRAEARAKLQGQQEAIVDMVEIRFPELLELARQHVSQLNDSKE